MNIFCLQELYLPLHGIDGAEILSEKYRISNTGRVYNILDCRYLKLSLCGIPRYYYVTLTHKGYRNTYRVNRLVALSFIENPENLPIVDHIDRDRLNNKVENLRWYSRVDNMRNSDAEDLRVIRRQQELEEKLGDEIMYLRSFKKLPVDIFRKIRYCYKHEYSSHNKLSRRFGLNKVVVEDILIGVEKKDFKPKFKWADCNRIYLRSLVRAKYQDKTLSGKSVGYKAIAEMYAHLGVTKSMVESFTRDLPNNKRPSLSRSNQELIYKEFTSGLSYMDCVRKFGITKSMMTNIKRRFSNR